MALEMIGQIARNVTMEGCGTLRDCRYLLHDRDAKYTQSFRAIIVSGRVKTRHFRLEGSPCATERRFASISWTINDWMIIASPVERLYRNRP
jgi:hypothetical protein